MDISSLTGPVLDNTIAALIGAFIISGLTWGYRRTRDSINEQKYSIKGDYRAYYEDIHDDGTITYEKANVTIKQKGLRIHAVDYDETQDKDWILNGEIDPISGHVSGRYTTKSKHETGLGVCILEKKKNGNLDGIWAGYDETVDVIERGRYTLVKRIDINIRKATKADSVTVLQLLDQELGEDWLHLEDIEKAIDDDFLFVADHNGSVIGFTLLRMLDHDDFKKEIKGHTYKIPRDIEVSSKNKSLGFIEAIATDPDYQKRGIGSRLIGQSINALQTAGAELICTLAWKTDHTHLAPTMDIFAFKERKEFEKFWHKESLKTDEQCPKCGNPCECNTVLYTKAL